MLLVLPLVAACARPPAAEPGPPPQPSVEAALRAAAAAGEVPSDFSVTFSDEHGMHGGTRITVSAGGAYAYRNRDPRSGESRAEGTLAASDLRDLIALLVELQVWRQETAPRQPVPDESSAGVRVRAGGAEATMWEWYNDMAANNRLIRIRTQMSALQQRLRPAGE